MTRILWVAPSFPWPVTSGGKARHAALISGLAAHGYRITLLAMVKRMPPPEAVAAARDILDHIVIVPRRKEKSLTTLTRSIFSLQRPVVATVNGWSAELNQHFSELLKRSFDIVQVEHSYFFESLSASLAAYGDRFVMTEHNVESELAALRYRLFPPPIRGLMSWVDKWRYQKWERHVLARPQLIIAVSKADAESFRRLGAKATAYVPNCIDTARHTCVSPTPTGPVLFLGNYEYSPNIDAVAQLCDHIMPQVWAHRPSTRLRISGYAMPLQWRQRWPDPRLEFSGFAASLIKAHRECAVFVAPLRDGGGTKLKVIEALASGLPIVASSQAVSGLNVQDRVHLRISDVPGEFAYSIIELLNNPQKAAEMGEKGRTYAVDNHDWSVAVAATENAYAKVVSGEF